MSGRPLSSHGVCGNGVLYLGFLDESAEYRFSSEKRTGRHESAGGLGAAISRLGIPRKGNERRNQT